MRPTSAAEVPELLRDEAAGVGSDFVDPKPQGRSSDRKPEATSMRSRLGAAWMAAPRQITPRKIHGQRGIEKKNDEHGLPVDG